MAIPTYIGLKTNLEKAKETTRHCQDLTKTLTESLAKRLGHVVTHSLYCISTFLDPHFKLKWCSSEAQRIAVKSMIFEELSTLSASSITVIAIESTAENTDETTPPAPKKTKIDRLFSFMENTETEGEATGIGEEYEAYLNSLVPQLTEKTAYAFALTFWKENADRFPQLAQLASRYFTVPATSAPVERVFSQAGKILSADRSRLLPKNFENLVFLKVNKNLL